MSWRSAPDIFKAPALYAARYWIHDGSDRIGVLPDWCDPRRVAPEEPFVRLPLCCGPNESHNNHRGLLIRWNHLNLRVTKAAIKFWMKICRCQVS